MFFGTAPSGAYNLPGQAILEKSVDKLAPGAMLDQEPRIRVKITREEIDACVLPKDPKDCATRGPPGLSKQKIRNSVLCSGFSEIHRSFSNRRKRWSCGLSSGDTITRL